jgi:hypothetical protein
MYGITEPGVHVIDSIYYLASGTSMACPYAAAAAGFVRAVSPGLSPDIVQNVMRLAADDIIDPYGLGEDYPGWDMYSGYGRINLQNAVNAAPKLRAKIQSPSRNQIVNGDITITGIADGIDFENYALEYGAGKNPQEWTTILESSTSVTNNTLGEFNSQNLNGIYTIRLRVGESNTSQVVIHFVNTSELTITSPLAYDTVISYTDIVGTAICPDFNYYSLEIGAGFSADTFELLYESWIPVYEGILLDWCADSMDVGEYTLKLKLYSISGLVDTQIVPIYVESYFSGENAWQAYAGSRTTCSPNYGDFDNDGINEIIVGNSEGLEFYNIDGTIKTTGIPSYPEADFRIPAAVGDLDNDNVDDFVAIGAYSTDTGSVGKLHGFLSGGTTFETNLEVSPSTGLLYGGTHKQWPQLFLKDIDNDGQDEIHYFPGWVKNNLARYFIFNSDGSFRMELPPVAAGNNLYFAYLPADLNGDGTDELYVADSGLYRVTHGGAIADSVIFGTLYPDFMTEDMSAADVDGDGKLELLIFGCYYHMFIPGRNYYIYAFNEDLSMVDGWPHDTGVQGNMTISKPIFCDIDNNGVLEYFSAAYIFATSGILAWNVDGSNFTGDSTNAYLAYTDHEGDPSCPVMSDVDGDGFADIIADVSHDLWALYDFERIIAWDLNGQILNGWPIITVVDCSQYAGGARRYFPVIGDIDKDGYTDMIITNPEDELLFLNFDGIYYLPQTTPVPTWKYNRRMNNIGPVRNLGVLCGDFDSTGAVNILDITYLINYLYLGGQAPDPLEMADVNSDGSINILDIIYLIRYLYKGGPEPNCP